MPKIEPFEKYRDAYDEWFDRNRDLYEAELKTIRLLMAESDSSPGLEVGVGTGKFAVPLGIKNGVEPSEQMAAKAEERGITVHSGIAEKLPFPDATFKFVLMVTTICFVDDITASFKEAFRVLQPYGYIIIGFVDKGSELGQLYRKNRKKSRFYGNATFYTVNDVLGHLKNAGFHTDRIKQTLIPGEAPETILDGSGSGAFVAVKGTKPAVSV
ncbi:MAG: class I SAM-dependent methyltransferase [Kiritimatiellia bacterium]